ncbi:MAG TPA: HAD-IA family hydrolase [Ktedonobacteraceae bacterium]|nr:HAD-IA family hydrolase [Ktedonobacteraceae bacterium]
MIRVILFDVDGVLAIGEPFSKHLARTYGITPDLTRSFFEGRFLNCLTGKADLKEELADRLPAWGWSSSIEAFLDEWFRFEHRINEPLIAYVQQLRQQHIRCYLATNQEKYRTAYLLAQMGFAGAFDGMFSSTYLGYMKGDEAFFASVLSQLPDVKANEILFWDDSPANVEVARKAGLHAEVYSSFSDFEKKMTLYDIGNYG